MRTHTGVEKVEGLLDGPLKNYHLDWHPATTDEATQREYAEAHL
jgi:hypothetical protein